MKLSVQLITTCLFALGILFTTSFSLQAQAFVVGDSTELNGSGMSKAYPTPYGDRFENMRAQYLYRATDLVAAGVPIGNITALGFFVVDVNGAGLHDAYTIKMATTNQTTISSWVSTAVTVYGPVDYKPYAGLNTYTLTTPFYWNGTDNVVIEICHGPENAAGGVFESANAVVQLTGGFTDPISLTYRVNDSNNVCAYSGTSSTMNVNNNSRPRLWLSVCTPPFEPVLNVATSNSAHISWHSPASGVPEDYQWVYGTLNFIPGGAGGTQLGSGSTLDTSVNLPNLNGNTAYSFYVRSRCDIGYSAWVGPVKFLTEASCGDEFSDTNDGLLGNYDTSENYVRVFCPDLAGNALKMNFTLFYTGIGDTLRVYNGDNVNAPLFGAFSGFYLLPLSGPGPFTATTSTGCLTIQFKSDTTAGALEAGWLANLTCAPLPADSCYRVLKLKTNVVNFSFAQVSWTKMFGAPDYTYKLVALPNTLVDSATTTNNVVDFMNLLSGTRYRLVVRSNCINGENSLWDTLYFDTPVRCDALPNGNSNLIPCGNQTQIMASGPGLWDVIGCGPNNHTPGKEQIYRFVAPQTRSYKLKMNFASNTNLVKYMYKPVSAGCGQTGWSCIGMFNNALDSAFFGPLVAGQEYYILADAMTTASTFQRFRILGCTPLNDEASSAIPLNLNTACNTNIYSNQDANFTLGEPNPDTVAADGYKGRWTEPAENTVWFSFVAPASGTITISTNKVAINPNGDTQIALYSAGDPADYSTFVLLESDEDNGAGFNSNFTYTGLEEGATYYLQVDSWDINAEGPFCIEVDEDAVRQTNDGCGQYSVTNLHGDKWYNVYTSPEISDIGKIVLAVNPLGQNLDTVFASILTFPTIPFSGNHVPYLPAYFRLRSSPALAGPIGVRLFFYDTELDALIDSAGLPANTASDLVISQYNGANTDCNQLNNTTPSNLITGIDDIQMNHSFYLEFSTPVLGEFGAHFGQLALPLELQSFTGKIAERSNLLEWVTRTEKNVQWHIVERSADGVDWSETGRLSGQKDSKTTKTYSLTDAQPLSSAYYRLRSVDADGAVAVSNVVRLVRPDRQFTITEVLPNPVVDRLTVRFHTPEEQSVSFQVFDFTGRLVMTQNAETQTGMNEIVLPLAGQPAGMYQILLTNGTDLSTPVRVVKQ